MYPWKKAEQVTLFVMIFIQPLIQSSHLVLSTFLCFKHDMCEGQHRANVVPSPCQKPETVSRAEWIAVGGRAPEEEGCRVWLVG